MNSVETRLQALVHSVEQGRIAGVIRVLLGGAAAVALALLYLLVQFRGLSTETGMDQAQISRELARGNGFSTKMIRPLAAQQLQDYTRRVPGTNFPDSFNAPLGPLVNSLAMLCLPGELTKKITNGDAVFAGDQVVAIGSVIFFLAAVVVNFFLVWRLFDRRIAWLTTVLVLLADQFWQFSLSGLPQMLLLFSFYRRGPASRCCDTRQGTRKRNDRMVPAALGMDRSQGCSYPAIEQAETPVLP